jgi:heme/flavin dehydrogenase (mycofactocin system)
LLRQDEGVRVSVGVAGPGDSFETVAEAERRAKALLPAWLYVAVRGGSERGITVADNADAFDDLGLVARVATGLSGPREQTTSVLGRPLALPVILSPTGAQTSVHPDGELGAARAAAAAGTAVGVSSFASTPIEQVVAANPDAFLQVFWLGGRERLAPIVERARAAGAKALILTLDYVFAHRKDWGTPVSLAHIPDAGKLTLARYVAGDAVRRPRWLIRAARSGRMPSDTVPNVGPAGGPAPTFFAAFAEWMSTPAPTWDDIAWLREQWGGPFVVKGITHPDDARRAVDAGATAISVSNYGGSNLDGTQATIRCLPAIADAVGDEIEVLLDGGVTRGSDVVKALALGARAVMIGRSFVWGLAVGGQIGVENVLAILRAGIDETLNGIGRASPGDLGPDDIVAPAGFETRAGRAAAATPRLAGTA